MNQAESALENKQGQLQEKVKKEIEREFDKEFIRLRENTGFSEEYEYFLHILSFQLYPEKFKEYIGKPLAGISCVQMPCELFDASGFHPLRLCSGSFAVQRLSLPHIPALTCPFIKSITGAFYRDESIEKLCDLIVIPSTCDWTVKLPEMTGGKAESIHVLELPHVKESERGVKRWTGEVYELKRILKNYSNKRSFRKHLHISINRYIDAWYALNELIQLKRKKLISPVLSMVVTNAFMLDSVESWTKNVQRIIKMDHHHIDNSRSEIFLAGSPIFFPNMKLARLIEEAGMHIAADELCTSERILTSVPVYDEDSEYGMMKALAESYHLSCSCPVYIDNERRIRNILYTMRTNGIKGVVYHVLKGCHPYDIDSFSFERKMKEEGFRFLKIETDYSKEDRMNILMRLEAFRETL
ncbi:MAG: 2-hydroxyacyl-CoA dehydratase [Spirochaetales bacterium]|nr:2-hydroxyacyl-CoA dehydratase [Spirochaetales bacterium]